MDFIISEKISSCIRQIANGRIEAVDELYISVGKLMYAVASLYLKQRADIEDSIHDTFITIVSKADRYRYGKNPTGWITTILKNNIKNKLKKTKQLNEVSLDNALRVSSKKNHFDAILVRMIFEQLNKKQRTLICYKYWYDLSLSEIAALMRKSKSTITYQMDAAERKIKFFLNSE